MSKEIVLMFSGGIDSTYAALQLVPCYDMIHLLTFSNGYGQMFMTKSKDRYEELNKLHPNKFTYNFFNVRNIFDKLLIEKLDKIASEFSSAFVWCFGCKLSMHAAVINYCKKHKIESITDGASYDTKEMIEQSPLVIELIKILYFHYNLNYTPTAYKINRDEKRLYLKKRNLNLGIQIFDRHIGIQPKCIPGELYYSPYILFGNKPRHDTFEVIKFFSVKFEEIIKLIK